MLKYYFHLIKEVCQSIIIPINRKIPSFKHVKKTAKIIKTGYKDILWSDGEW